jgi:hypothetical protein
MFVYICINKYKYICNSQLDLSKLTRVAREPGKKKPYKNFEIEKKLKNLNEIKIAENLVKKGLFIQAIEDGREFDRNHVLKKGLYVDEYIMFKCMY